MSQQAYTELLSAFCEHVQAANPADILEHGNLHIGEVAFTLVHDDSLGRDDILIYCDFGPLPQDDPATEYLDLLHTNLQLYSGSIGSSFAVNPESGNVLLLAYQRMTDATPERLASHLAILAELALMWRRGETVLTRLAASRPNPLMDPRMQS